MQDDPQFARAFAQALQIADNDGDAVALTAEPDDLQSEVMSMMAEPQKAKGNTAQRVAEFTGNRLREDTRIASFSINGWDTHQAQDRSLPRALARLADAILTLRNTVKDPIWNKTTVVAVTEFGRTARINGSGGTDHGTGGLMLLAGGALRGGRVAGDWPGLSETALLERRDLMPTRDLRSYLGWILHSQFGLSRSTLERDIFPDLDMGRDPKLLHL
jgi:uncharacterized protein (DUF1501 family)